MQLHTGRPSPGAQALAAPALAAALLLCWPCPSPAQSGGPPRRDERRIEMETRQRELRSLSDINAKPPKKAPDDRPLYQQVAEDFEQLQLRGHYLSVAGASGSELDYGQIRDEAAELKRRASRLKSTLALPALKKDQKQKRAEAPPAPEAVRAAITSLEAAVKSFVWNPFFQRPDVLDAENSSKASRDLEEILRLSEQIRGAAEALAKGKPPTGP
jgi:hypothetical protein